MIKAVEAHIDSPVVLLYVRRWLAAPLNSRDGTLAERDRGTPQGSAVSPVLANLFMHFAFDNGWPSSTRMPLRALCRRCRRALRDKRQAGACLGNRNGWQRSGSASTRQDPDRVLQG